MDGEIVCLLGHNGAGKTTLIKCLASLLYPSEGTIEYNGINIYSNIKEYRTKTSYLLGGKKGLYNRLSGRDNVEYIAALKGIFGDNLQSDIEKYFDELGILKFIDERVENYSRGMKQKVHLINSLITDSQVIFLDEPTSGMDSIAESKVYEDYNFLTSGKTALFISHRLASTLFCSK
ncbi:MAG: ABC transporter ATP-binding protein [Clostridiales bacterium]|nr:ABC transporter ATP-binding protein [Clostridiales bacterium]